MAVNLIGSINPVRLRGLPPVFRFVATIAAGIAAAAAAIVLVVAAGVDLPGGTSELVDGSAIPRALIALFSVGLAVGSASLVLATRQYGWPFARTTGCLVAAIGGLLCLQAIDTPSVWSRAFGWVGVGAGCLLAGSAFVARSRPLAVAALAAIPGLALLGAYLLASAAPYRVVNQDQLADRIVTLVASAGAPISLLALWGVVASARVLAARGAGGLVARLRQTGLRRSAVVYALSGVLVIKAGWLVLGYAGWLPTGLGGRPEVFGPSRHDGFAWLIAAGLVAAAWWGLWRRRGWTAHVGATTRAAWLVIGALVGVEALIDTVFVVAAALQPVAPALIESVQAPLDWLLATLVYAPIVSIAGAAFVVWLATSRATLRPLVPLLVAYAVWGVPKAAAVIVLQVHGPDAPDLFVDALTIDTLVTGILLVIMLVYWTGRRFTVVDPPVLAGILAVSTAIAVLPRLPYGVVAVALFWLGVVLPPIWELFADADRLNRPSVDRPRVVLGVTALAALSLCVFALLSAYGKFGPNQLGYGDLGRALLLVPFTAVLLAARLPRPAALARPTA